MPGAHPRSRGEHIRYAPEAYLELGSSPLARGTPLWSSVWRRLCGLIPARAGNTAQRIYRGRRGRAHPRSRGEHNDEWGSVNNDAGSSPLARGTQVGNLHGFRLVGLIPARAGNT